MAFLEDSGVESEDKTSLLVDQVESNCISGNDTSDRMVDLKVTFRRSTAIVSEPPKPLSLSSVMLNSNTEDALQPPSTCRILQRKLELKVERAKRNYSHYQESNKKKPQSAALIPINRLQIPGDREQNPLVDYKSESDDGEEISFFPNHYKERSKRQTRLSDTFSIQEMSIDSDLESNDSQNLELLTPHIRKNFLDYLVTCLCF